MVLQIHIYTQLSYQNSMFIRNKGDKRKLAKAYYGEGFDTQF